jgi:hypothetical protein
MYYNYEKTVKLTKANTIFVKDEDGHDFAIHEDDESLFYKILEEAYVDDDFNELEDKFHSIGGDPNIWRKQNLK